MSPITPTVLVSRHSSEQSLLPTSHPIIRVASAIIRHPLNHQNASHSILSNSVMADVMPVTQNHPYRCNSSFPSPLSHPESPTVLVIPSLPSPLGLFMSVSSQSLRITPPTVLVMPSLPPFATQRRHARHPSITQKHSTDCTRHAFHPFTTQCCHGGCGFGCFLLVPDFFKGS